MNNINYEIFVNQLSGFLNVVVNEKINLKDYANKNKLRIYSNKGVMDKGWKGNTVEHLLNIKNSNDKNPDYGFLEVKTVPVIFKEEKYKIKETTCLGVIDTNSLLNNDFESSDLFKKINKTIFIFINVEDENNPFIVGYEFLDLNKRTDLKEKFKQDYEDLVSHVYDNLNLGKDLDSNFSGNIGKYIQPRPKNGGKKIYTWAFYMKVKTWEEIFNQQEVKVKNKF